jgi:glycosyltransferase involved in cell wall biosynthesis
VIRVLQVIGSSEVGGGPKHLLSLIKHLDRKAFYTIVACPPSGPLGSDLKKMRIKVIPVEMEKSRFNLRLIPMFWRLIKAERISLIHCHGPRAAFFCSIGAKLNKIPMIYTPHVFTSHENMKRALEMISLLIDKYICLFPDRIISVSERARYWAITQRLTRPDKIVTIRNGIDLSEFRGLDGLDLMKERLRFRIDPHESIVGMIARLVPQKDPWYFIEAAAEIVKTNPKVRFLVIGDGHLREKTMKMVEDLKLGRHVVFAGIQRRIPPLLAIMDVVVLPSLWEGLPLVILEAMAMGKPVVATRVNGSAEVVIDGKTGFLVPPKDPACLAQKIVSLLNDCKKREEMGIKGREVVEKEFQVKDMVKKIIEIYRNVLNGYPS